VDRGSEASAPVLLRELGAEPSEAAVVAMLEQFQEHRSHRSTLRIEQPFNDQQKMRVGFFEQFLLPLELVSRLSPSLSSVGHEPAYVRQRRPED